MIRMFPHDCEECVYLGSFRRHDLYYCRQDTMLGGGTLVARYGHAGPEYMSAPTRVSIHWILTEARHRALARGLICDEPTG